MSISKAQAAALADQFLDDLGSDDKDTLRPRETFTELILLAGELIEDAYKNLIDNKNISSGALAKSLEANEPTLSGNILSMDIMMNFYGQFVNKGVKGTKSGMSRAGYSFKNDMPSRKMVKAFEEYIGRSRRSTVTVKKYAGYGSHETKQKSLSKHDSAFALARSIKMLGLKPTGFLDKAIDKTEAKVLDRLGAAFRIDIINSI